ncbi:hypothetical protein BH11ACT4_BH11ACT4_24590 [soil metagenome]
MKIPISGATIASEVQAIRGTETGPIVLVEGTTDSILYRRFFAHASTYRLISCLGKPNLIDAMNIIDRRGVAGVIAICDSDYDPLIGVAMPPGVLSTDQHDAEVMCWAVGTSDDCARELAHLAGTAGANAADAAAHAMEIGARIGSIRLANLSNGWSLRFRAVDPGDYVRSVSQFDEQAFVTDLLDLSDPQTIGVQELLSTFRGPSAFASVELVNGHDLASLVDAFTAAENGSSRVGSATVEAMMRLALHPALFQRTNLLANIRAWESTTGLELLIPELAA